MSIFITQGNYTGQAIKGMVSNPEDRKKAVAGLMESVGAKLLQYYVTTGEYDFLVIAEGDSLTDVLAGLMIAGSSGGVTNLKTVQALTTQEAKLSMEKAKTARAGFKGPGAGS
ncbi:GYD domain-containing protein [Sedimenticola selenatireducens]|uniref:GYD domain-containing protein n=1 Tax=Sedimenticola selenatireducens TaxID=191960 RepID=A0A2N6D191_9GAMM|nr:GYD domain-containing protein [Sedimenticola selenatireducens]PLX63462.1 MAG: GYD domain-containing protein [Sedimenticola selenatireducens]